MCSRRFLPTLGLSVVLCCVAFGGYYSFLKATIDGGYTEWSVWSNCSKDCGEGFQTRYRNCAQPPPGRYGKDCYRFGPNNDKKPCFLKICPIDGKFSEWSSFSACDRSCGGGKQFRTRRCNNPPAVFEGKPCEGPSRQEQPCNTHECPIDGGYTQWSEYGPCSVTCGEGVKTEGGHVQIRRRAKVENLARIQQRNIPNAAVRVLLMVVTRSGPNTDHVP